MVLSQSRLSLGLSLALLATSLGAPIAAIAAESQQPIVTIAQAATAQKRRIAVLDFDGAAVSQNAFVSGFLGQGASKGVSDLLVTKLVDGGTYRVIERSRLEQIMQEQDLGNSGRVDASTAARLGKLLGVEAVLVGSITQFNVERRSSGGGFFGMGGSTQTANAIVEISARLIDTETGEIISTAQGKGQSEQGNTSVSIFGIGGNSSASNEETLLKDAADKAVAQVVTSVNSAATKISALSGNSGLEAVVADIAGGVTLNKGTSAGITKGMKFSIERIAKQIKDPSTGKVIRTVSASVGQIEITEVGRDYAVGRVISGTGFKVGDSAKSI
jgi:curli biogenesis system outer membrane secretion channel CsgG